jgi:magnesium transporter
MMQDYLNIELDSHRNQLIQLELVLTAAMFALALVTVIAGIFGMNLNNSHEDSYSAFVTVSSTIRNMSSQSMAWVKEFKNR